MRYSFDLENVLEQLGVTKNHLAVETKIRPATILDLSKGKTRRVELATIETLLDEINKIARDRGIEKVYTIDDLIKYQPMDGQ